MEADETGKIVKAKARLVVKGFKQKTAYEIASCLVGSEMCIRDSCSAKSAYNISDAEMGPRVATRPETLC